MSRDPRPLHESFPDADAGMLPLGSMVMLQLKSPMGVTSGGIVLPDTVQESQKWAIMIAKVIAHGPLAYRNRATGELWPEGAWCQPGDFVRVKQYGGQRWHVPLNGKEDSADPSDFAIFVMVNDLDLAGIVTPHTHPNSIRDYL